MARLRCSERWGRSDRAARAFFLGSTARLPASVALEPARVGAENSLYRRHVRASPGRIPEAQRAAFVDEICRQLPVACLTHLSAWRKDSPRSKALARSFATARPEIEHLLAPGLADRLVGFFEESPEELGEALRLAEIEKATQDFVRFYVHAAPFERAALNAHWTRCRDARGGRLCAKRRDEIELRLGSLAESLPD